MNTLPQPLWDRVIRYAGLEQKLIKIKQRDWRFEEARAYLNRVHHLYMCIRTTPPSAARVVRMERLQTLMLYFERQHLKPGLRHMILMGEVHRKMCCTDRRRHRYVELYTLYRHLKRYVDHPDLAFYPYVEYHIQDMML